MKDLMKHDIGRIVELMSVFDAMDSSVRRIVDEGDAPKWQPANEREAEAFRQLTISENREALRTWYAEVDSLNQIAARFRRILQRMTGEELPLKGVDADQ
jgi:hypothetical protein